MKLDLEAEESLPTDETFVEPEVPSIELEQTQNEKDDDSSDSDSSSDEDGEDTGSLLQINGEDAEDIFAAK